MANVFEIIFKATGLESITGAIRSKLGQLVTLAAAWKAAASAFSAYQEKASALADLDSGLRTAGQLTEEYRTKLMGLADSMELVHGLAEDKVLSAFGRLSRDGMNPDNADQLAQALVNLAGLMGGDTSAAAVMLGKAMNGNFDQFGRMGIQAKTLEKLFEELGAKGADLLKERMKTLGGQVDTLKAQIGNLGEAAADTKAWAFLSSALGEAIRTTTFFIRAAAEGREEAKKLDDEIYKGADFFDRYNERIGKSSKATEAKARADREATASAQAHAEAEKKVLDALVGVNEALERRARREASLRDATLALTLAQIDEQEASGKISGDKAGIMRDEASRAADIEAIQKQERDNKFRQDEIARALDQVTDPAERDKLLGQRGELQDEANTFPIKKQAVEAQGRAARARIVRSGRERADQESERATKDAQDLEKKQAEDNDPLNQLNRFKAAESAREQLMERANKLAADIPDTVTLKDAILALEKVSGPMTNQKKRYMEMTGQLEKIRRQIENGRS